VITLRPYYRRKPQTLHDAESRSIPIYVVKSNTVLQLEQAIMSMRAERTGDPVLAAVEIFAKCLTEDTSGSTKHLTGPRNVGVRVQNRSGDQYRNRPVEYPLGGVL